MADLDTGDVDVVPGFTGRLLHRFDPEATARADEQVYRTMISALPEGVARGGLRAVRRRQTRARGTADHGEDVGRTRRRDAGRRIATS